MPKGQGKGGKQAESYTHGEATRVNIPESGQIDYVPKERPKPGAYAWDPRESPQLVWAGKAGLRKVEVDEEASLTVPTVNLHIHERVSTEAILRAVQREDAQRSLFADPELDFRQEVQFYQHEVDWSNRMILGDSLLVMNSLLEREGMRGSVQCIYMDPPYGIKYASNFQPRIDQRDVKDGKDEDLTREVMQVQAFRDTWELGVHSYLTYLRDRLLVARELLTDSGSIFVQIGDENVHRVRCLMDEVFGEENFCAQIVFQKTTTTGGSSGLLLLPELYDVLLWFARDITKAKFRQLFIPKQIGGEGVSLYTHVDLPNGSRRRLTKEERETGSLPEGARPVGVDNITSPRPAGEGDVRHYKFQGYAFSPGSGTFKTSRIGLDRLTVAGRIAATANRLGYVRFVDDFPAFPIGNIWTDTVGQNQFGGDKQYVVQTALRAVERCILMTTDPGDLVLDPTCGSGTTAYVAEQWGRRWITMDTSRVALAIARHRLMTASYEYYKLRHPASGVSGGFVYKTVPHITLKSIAQNPEIDTIAAEYQPRIDAALAEVNGGISIRPKVEAWMKRKGLGSQLREWEVPRDISDVAEGDTSPLMQTWQLSLDQYWTLKREMQAKIDASIARNAPMEELVDQPEREKGIVRVSGPFTMEAVPNVGGEIGMEVSDGGTVPMVEGAAALGVTLFEPGQPVLAVEARNVSAYVGDMTEKLRKTGVVARGGKKLAFQALRPLEHPVLHAEGEVANGETRRVAVVFGPPNGAVAEGLMREAMRASARYDALLVCGYDFTAMAQEQAQLAAPAGSVLTAYVAPDTVMGDLLKDTKASQLFTMMGEPDVVVYRHGDPDLPRLVENAVERGVRDVAERAAAMEPGQIFLELRGVDLYDPLSGEVTSDRGENVHAVFVDQDYDGKSFCVCQALFPNKKDSWTKIATSLKWTLDEDAFSAFRTLVSLPFTPGTSFDRETGQGRVQVKVIDQRGNAVVKTVRV